MNLVKKLFSFEKREVAFFFKNARIKKNNFGLKLYILKSPHLNPELGKEHGKILIITPRKSGKAHERNLFRRRIKAIYFQEKLYLVPKIFALYAYQQGVSCDFLTLKKFLIESIS